MNHQLDNYVNNFWKWLEQKPKLRMLIYLQILFAGSKISSKILRFLKFLLFSSNKNIIQKIQQIYNPDKKSWAVVTGGSMGIGQAISVLLAKAGFNLVIISNDQMANNEIQKIIHENSSSVEVKAIYSDFLSENQNQLQQVDVEGQYFNKKQFNFIENLKEHFKPFSREKKITMLVNCAGLSGCESVGMIEEIESQSIINMMQVNSIALMQLTKFVIDYFNKDIKQKKAIINMGSISSKINLVYIPSYSIMKTMVEGFGQALGVELIGKNIHVLTMTPWHVQTRMTGFRDNSFFIITPEQLAEQILIDLYNEKRLSIGHWRHKLLFQLYQIAKAINPRYAFKKLEDDWKIAMKHSIQLNQQHKNLSKNQYMSDIGVKRKMQRIATPLPGLYNLNNQ